MTLAYVTTNQIITLQTHTQSTRLYHITIISHLCINLGHKLNMSTAFNVIL